MSVKLESKLSRHEFFKKGTNEFNFTTMIPQVDLFSFVFWKKLNTPKRHFESKWPLYQTCTLGVSPSLVSRWHKATLSGVVEDLKFKISEGSDPNWCFS